MATALKRKQVRMYLKQEDEDRLDRLSKAIPVLSEAMIISTILSAGLAACSEAGNRLPLPLKFQVLEGAAEKDPTPSRLKR
jgi:hypothetical protein